MSKKKDKIIFVKVNDATFINKDIPILEQFGSVEVIHYQKSHGLAFFWSVFISGFKMLRLLRHSKAVYVWFADYHAFLPVLLARWFKKPCYVNVAGYDASHFPELNYGAYTTKLRAFCTRYAIRKATKVLLVASSLEERLKRLAGPLNDNLTTIHFGFDATHWFRDTEKKKQVITVAIFDNERRLKIKGLDFYASVAKAMPQYEFIIVGGSEAGKALLDTPQNLIILPPKSQPELRQLYSESQIYAQFSLSEGLPNAVIEASLCECVAVGTNVGGIPDIITDKRYILEPRNLDDAVAMIETAMNDNTTGKKARQHALDEFPLDKRSKLLARLFQSEGLNT